jgi:hypothetical protein
MITGALSQREGLDFHPSLRDLLQGKVFELLVGDQALQLAVLFLELLQPLDVGGLHAAVLVSPAVKGLLGDLQGLCRLGHLLAFAEHRLGLPELADDLLGGVSPSLHLRRSSLAHCRGPEELSQGADRFQGVMPGGQDCEGDF